MVWAILITSKARVGPIPPNQGRDWPTRTTLQTMTTISNLISATATETNHVSDGTTMEDLKAMTKAMLDYCYDNDISIEDADL